MQQTNTILEDIGAEIGYHATANLCGWFGGKIIWIPREASPGHTIAKVIGMNAFERLAKDFGDQRLFVPKDAHQSLVRRRRQVHDLVRQGKTSSEIGATLGITRNQAHNIRRELEDTGLLPMILTAEARAQIDFEESIED